jgi:hypothetical protein
MERESVSDAGGGKKVDRLANALGAAGFAGVKRDAESRIASKSERGEVREGGEGLWARDVDPDDTAVAEADTRRARFPSRLRGTPRGRRKG